MCRWLGEFVMRLISAAFARAYFDPQI